MVDREVVSHLWEVGDVRWEEHFRGVKSGGLWDEALFSITGDFCGEKITLVGDGEIED